MNDSVSAQYEAYPYPPRDPDDEAKRLVTGSPSHLLEVNHYIFAGRRDFARPFRALVAGGGTGDATIMLAQQLADHGAAGEVVHLDLSEASTAVARCRAEKRGLKNVRFVRASLLDAAGMGIGPFDYIDCCGVLHHLYDPEAGLRALESVLADDGGMGIMVYAPFGRTGVYPAQAMLRMLGADAPATVRLDFARRLLRNLPETNWLRRNPFVGDHTALGDAGLFDLLLHSQDRPFSVFDVVQLAASARLRLVAFIDPLRYEPVVYVKDREILNRVQELPMLQRWAFSELISGNMRKHVFYAVKAVNKERTIAAPDNPDAVPILRDLDGEALARESRPGGSLTVDFDGIKARFPLPALTPTLFRMIDGKRSIRRIHAALEESFDPAPDWSNFKSQFDRLYLTLNGLSRLFLRQG